MRSSDRTAIPDRPVLDVELGHGEVLGVAGRQSSADTDGGGGDQAVGLAEGDSLLCILSAPASCPFPLGQVEPSQTHAAQETREHRLLRDSGSAQHLLGVDRADPRGLTGIAQRSHALGGWTTAQHIDQDGCVEQQPQALTDTTRVGVSLRRDPRRGVRIPLVLSGKAADPGFDVFPALLVLEGLAHGLRDEHAATPPPDAPVEPLHEIAVQSNVQTHGHNLAHTWSAPAIVQRRC